MSGIAIPSDIVLAIDAAWTPTKPSGVALVVTDPSGWRNLTVAPSYAEFLAAADGKPIDWSGAGAPTARDADASLLLAAARSLAGSDVTLVAVDMPLAVAPFASRRAADDAVSKAFGARGCSTHSPSATRPGPVGSSLMRGLEAAGYPLATASVPCGTARRTIEVYPHPALLALLSCDERVRYKVSKSRKYWPDTPVLERIALILLELSRIERALSESIRGAAVGLPELAQVRSLASLKRYEDALDALICAWVAIRYLEGQATPFGDDIAAIWVPCGRDALPS
jgi:predicted RNase H-like nuclease